MRLPLPLKPISIDWLYQRFAQSLALSWISCPKAAKAPIPQSAWQWPYIQFFNPLRPAPIALLGPPEVQQLTQLNHGALAQSFKASHHSQGFIFSQHSKTDSLPNLSKALAPRPWLSSPLSANQIFNQLANYLDTALAPKQSVHGVFLTLFGLGVLVQGRSQIGKSTLALALLEKKHQLIADDRPYFKRLSNSEVIGYCPSSAFGLLMVPGLGAFDVRQHYGQHAVQRQAPLNLIIQLVDTPLEPTLSPNVNYRYLLGRRVAEMTLPNLASDNLVILMENTVKYFLNQTAAPTAAIDPLLLCDALCAY